VINPLFARPGIPLRLALAGALFAFTGCAFDKYRLAKDNTPPAGILDWKATVPSAELTVQSVIVFKGPGSWKSEARWDEYVVQVANHGDLSVTIASVTLTDLQGNPQFPGADPWKLEKLSSTNWDKYGSTGLNLLAGAGTVAVFAGAPAAIPGGPQITGGTAVAIVAGTAAYAIPYFFAIPIIAVPVANHSNKNAVEAEFDRRRLKLPLTIAPGATARGSLFFPMTPGPQRLTLKGKSGETPLELVLELKPLAGLHLKPAEKK
jgi:hypothetical protein